MKSLILSYSFRDRSVEGPFPCSNRIASAESQRVAWAASSRDAEREVSSCIVGCYTDLPGAHHFTRIQGDPKHVAIPPAKRKKGKAIDGNRDTDFQPLITVLPSALSMQAAKHLHDGQCPTSERNKQPLSTCLDPDVVSFPCARMSLHQHEGRARVRKRIFTLLPPHPPSESQLRLKHPCLRPPPPPPPLPNSRRALCREPGETRDRRALSHLCVFRLQLPRSP